jgi:hypothetical protein
VFVLSWYGGHAVKLSAVDGRMRDDLSRMSEKGSLAIKYFKKFAILNFRSYIRVSFKK